MQTDRWNKVKNTLFISNIEEVSQRLELYWQQFRQKGWDEEKLAQLIHCSQELCTIAANKQHTEVANTTNELTQLLRNIYAKNILQGSTASKVADTLDQINRLTKQLQPNNIITFQPSSKSKHRANKNQFKVNIGLLESDAATSIDIKKKLNCANYGATVYDNLDAMKSAMAKHKFDLLIVDLLLPNCPLSSAISVEDFLSNNPIDIPVIMLSEHANLATRLVALRAGIKAYITKPAKEEELLGKVESILSRRCNSRTKVLVCDDDPMLTEYYEIALGEEGFIVKTQNDPLQLLETIESFKPDIVTLDYMMPGCSGLEAAEILRGDPRYMDTPILFMSGSEEAEQRKGLMDLFGNSFLQKPVDIDKLSASLHEITAEAQKKDKKETVETPNVEANKLQTQCLFLSSLKKVFESNLIKQDIENNHYLALISINKTDYIKKEHGSLALAELEEEIESFFASHPLIKGQGCKYGEHGFLLHLSNKTKHTPNELLANLQTTIKQQVVSGRHQDCNISLSIGASPLDDNTADSLEDLLILIEEARKKSLNSDENTFFWTTQKSSPDAAPEKIVQALKEKSFELVFQPIVKPDSNEHIFEALVRLRDDSGEIYTPANFIDLLEDTLDEGSYHLDRWVIENAFRSLENINGRGASEFSIIIKLSPNLKQIERLIPFIFNITSNSRLRGANRIFFSIPEKALLSDINLSNAIIDSIHMAGCGFIIEHCMANEKSAEAIELLHKIDLIKLDPSLNYDKKSKQAVKKIQSLVRGRSELIASLVEDAKTFAYFWDMDIRLFQGFFIHRPNNNMKHSPFEAETLVLER